MIPLDFQLDFWGKEADLSVVDTHVVTAMERQRKKSDRYHSDSEALKTNGEDNNVGMLRERER